MKQSVAVTMLLITSLIWGSGFVVTDIGLDYLNAYQLMAGRFLLAAIILIVLFVRKLKQLTKSVILKGAILGIMIYIGFILQTIGLEHTTASKNAVLTAVNVLVVPVIAYVVSKRKFDYFEIISAVLAIVGIALLSLKDSFTMNIGDFLTLLCAVAFAFDIFYTNIFVQKEDPLLLTLMQFITAAILSLIFILLRGDIPTTIQAEGIYSVVYLAIFSTIIAYLLQNTAFKYTSATKGAIILTTEALFGMIFSVLFLHEILSGRMISGAILILVAIVYSELKPSFRKKKQISA